MFSKTIIASSMLSIAAAVPLAAPPAVVDTFTLTALHSGSPLHFQAINANSERLWIGKPTTTYCPPTESYCPGGNVTAFNAIPNQTGANSIVSLDAVVPGGQKLYVTYYGEIGFTTPYSIYPRDANITGFLYTQQTDENHVGNLQFNGQAFVACPVEVNDTMFMIYSPTAAGFYREGCTPINLGTMGYAGEPTYTYA